MRGKTTYGDKSKHGDSNSPEYKSWASMIQRCYNANASNYHLYGGRGITVCTEWRNSYEAFLAYMGRKPSLVHSIDRYPNQSGNYEPGNVRWATPIEQQNNIRRNNLISACGTTQSLSAWSRVTGIARSVIENRCKRGWTTEQALGLTSRPGKKLREGQRFLGVIFENRYTKKWRADVYDPISSRCVHVGRFASDYDAALAYNFAALELIGDKAFFNNTDNISGGRVRRGEGQ